jgi:hypothetical protein
VDPQQRKQASRQRHAEYPLRFIIFHLHPLSARLHFLKFAHRHLCAPIPLPALSELLESPAPDEQVRAHPGGYLQSQLGTLGLPVSELKVEPGFRVWIDTPAGALPLYLVRVQGEQPFAPPAGSQWMELPDSFSLLAIEREILRHAYAWLLE